MISTHAPLAGRDPISARSGIATEIFQPTRPLRGATSMTPLRFSGFIIFQPTRPLRGATIRRSSSYLRPYKFQPTRPLRGATVSSEEQQPRHNISTHAPLAGRDLSTCASSVFSSDFNPRAPCGARLQRKIHLYLYIIFQPTRPLRGATRPLTLTESQRSGFQPTRPLRGAT